MKRAEAIFRYTENWKGDGKVIFSKQRFANAIGVYRYYSLVLAQFNPILADEIYDQPADKIAQAFVAQICYNYVEPDKKASRL